MIHKWFSSKGWESDEHHDIFWKKPLIFKLFAAIKQVPKDSKYYLSVHICLYDFLQYVNNILIHPT